MSWGMEAVTSGAWMPLRWQISSVVGVERMVAVLPAVSVRVMELMVREKLRSWSEGASVMRTGTVAAGVVMLVTALGVTAEEQPRAAARAAEEARAKRGVRTFMVVLQ